MSEYAFSSRMISSTPFPHVRFEAAMPEAEAACVLEWLDGTSAWSLTEADFYEQREFSLLGRDLPLSCSWLVAADTVTAVAHELRSSLDAGPLELVDVNVHRMTAGMTIRLHNDHLDEGRESHRLLIQLNRGWSQERGGLLMLFDEDLPESLSDILLPVHRSAFGFEISPRSHHAVSTVHSGVRDTLVYTFRQAA